MIPPFFNPVPFLAELIYTVVITAFCFLIFFKTKEIYDLTKHNGIKFFRYTFLFFGLSYASRLLLHLFMLYNGIIFEMGINRRAFLPLSNLIMAYFSTMAILYLAFSTLWKRIKIRHLALYSNLFAVIIAFVGFFSRSPLFISLIQLILLALAIIVNAFAEKKSRKVSNMRILYLMIAAFWLINLFLIDPHFRFHPAIKLVLQGFSIIVFIIIHFRLNKWLK